MQFSPVVASENIVAKYKRYLNTVFQIRDLDYAKQFKNLLNSKQEFARGPYLDVTDSFVKASTINQLISQKVLPKGFSRLNVPLDRTLYMHQEIAIKKAAKGENLVVSTGTGSGKTESFLYPILSELIKEYEAGTLGKGVRALLIYPMNALANDQIERLRKVLVNFPEITYGSYTGQTQQEYADALREYKTLNNNENPLKNELISREQMKKTPPNILITNYAMLEYLMLRPADSVFFKIIDDNNWKFIVLDEAHVYNGSTGIEVSMLLRRLKATLENENIQYILTSATLGDEKQNEEVAQFAQNLCDSEFNKNSVIRAKRVMIERPESINVIRAGFYDKIALMIDQENSDIDIINAISEFLNVDIDSTDLSEVLYDVVLKDKLYWDIKEKLTNPKTVISLSKSLGITQKEIADFVTVASKCEKNTDKLFDARYHMFLKATESVFITLQPSAKLFLSRKEFHYEDDETQYKVFEIATCSSCHAIYLVGEIKNDILYQASNVIDPDKKAVFLLSDEYFDTDDDHSLEDEEINVQEYKICPRCGYLYEADIVNPTKCEHNPDDYKIIYKVKKLTLTGKLTKCLQCENNNPFGILRMFFTGQEAVTSVIGTALYEELPAYTVVNEKVESIIEEDEFGFDFDDEETVTNNQKLQSKAKQFIAFSDSRQAAAYYASYFDQTYKSILYKRVILETLKEQENQGDIIYFNRLVKDLSGLFTSLNVIDSKNDNSKKEATKAILAELVDNNNSNSLYNMGLLGFSLPKEKIPSWGKYNLNVQETLDLLNVFISGMLSDAAIKYEESFDRDDKSFFTNNGAECTYTYSDSDNKKLKKSFIPTKDGLKNKRIDYLVKVLSKAGVYNEELNILKLMQALWDKLLIDKKILINDNQGFKIDSSNLTFSTNNKWYICNKCKKITMYNVKNVCPTYKCDGELVEVDLSKILKDNHYYNLYQNLDIRNLKIVEHTAQLDKKTAYEYQKAFVNKEIDILSCSTTFEMGVDVGSLETVFMRNMPPSPSNYAQRAGRAGRSSQSAAFALTFCNKSNHDFAYFQEPTRMIKGKINPPKFNVENDKIAIRHLFASSFSYFWKKDGNAIYFKNAQALIEEGGAEKYKEYILSQPEQFKEFAKRFLPRSLVEKFDIENFGWAERLFSQDELDFGLLEKAICEYNYEIDILKAAKQEAIQNNTDEFSRLDKRIKVFQKENILAFLSRKNILPKYGFPVDTVELKISGSKGFGLQLQRDLEAAISEYAPNSQIVANGNLITSRYINKVPGMSWKQYSYKKCKSCQTLNVIPHVESIEDNLKQCKQCKESLEDVNGAVFLIPEFGFATEAGKIDKPKLIKPDRTYSNEISYISNKRSNFKEIKIGNCVTELATNKGEEMAILNTSNFFVCQECGYTHLDNKCFSTYKKKKHNKPSGYNCYNDGSNTLRRFSLGYRFETDVAQLRFISSNLSNYENAMSILYGILSGIYSKLNIESSDISGCLQYYYNEELREGNFAIILFDKTPGGAGFVKRLSEDGVLESVLQETLRIMKRCNCGGETGDSSCYSCLRSYYNQKFHDILKRSTVINFIEGLLK